MKNKVGYAPNKMRTKSFQISPIRSFSIGELVLPLVGFFALYVLTISVNLSEAHDAIGYLNCIDRREYYFHPHHLLYIPLAIIWITLCRSSGIFLNSEFLVPMLNSLFGALTLSAFYWLLRRRLQFNIPFAFIGTSLVAFSFGFWFYSVCVEVYIMPLFFLMLCFCLITSEHIDQKTAIITGLIHGLAVLFHQAHVLFACVVVAAFFLNRRRITLRVPRLLATYILTFFLTATIPYLLIGFGFLKLRSLAEFTNWVLTYARRTGMWRLSIPSSLAKVVIGFGMSIIGAHFLFAIPRFAQIAKKLLGENFLLEEEFLVRNLGNDAAYILLVLSVVFFLTVAINLLSRLGYLRLFWSRPHKLIALAVIWFISYGSFFLVWSPENVEFWIPQSICFWLIFLVLQSEVRNIKKSPNIKLLLLKLSIIVLLIFTVNFVGSIWWLKHRENDFYPAMISTLLQNVKRGDLIIIGRKWILKEYLTRYTEAEVLALNKVYYLEQNDPQKAMSRVKNAIEETLNRGRRVFISQEAVKIEPQVIYQSGEGILVFEKLWDIYQDRWTKIEKEIGKIYILDGNVDLKS